MAFLGIEPAPSKIKSATLFAHGGAASIFSRMARRLRNWKRMLARAVAALGGRLVIEWDDV